MTAHSRRPWRVLTVGRSLAVLVAVLCLLPLLWLLLGSLSDSSGLLSQDLRLWPEVWTLDNYRAVFSGGVDIWGYAWNTFVLCILRALGTLIASSLAAYAFARLEFPFRRTLFSLTLSLLILPAWALLIPQYGMFDALGWLGSNKPLIVPWCFGDPFSIFLLAAFMRSIPRDLTEAAKIDGASEFTIYLRIVMPNIKPALAITGILSVVDTYNDFFGQIIYLTSDGSYTLALAAFQFVKQHGAPDIGAVIALTVVVTLPLMVLFAFAQKPLRETFIHSGSKG